MEKGSIILIGATTENPSFEINGALLSRVAVVLFSTPQLEEDSDAAPAALLEDSAALAE